MVERRKMPVVNDMTAMIQAVGELSGETRAMHASLSESIKVIRDDIKRIETSTNENLLHMENRINTKVDSVSKRVSTLEATDKSMGEKITKVITVTGLTSGAMVIAAVELLKRL